MLFTMKALGCPGGKCAAVDPSSFEGVLRDLLSYTLIAVNIILFVRFAKDLFPAIRNFIKHFIILAPGEENKVMRMTKNTLAKLCFMKRGGVINGDIFTEEDLKWSSSEDDSEVEADDFDEIAAYKQMEADSRRKEDAARQAKQEKLFRDGVEAGVRASQTFSERPMSPRDVEEARVKSMQRRQAKQLWSTLATAPEPDSAATVVVEMRDEVKQGGGNVGGGDDDNSFMVNELKRGDSSCIATDDSSVVDDDGDGDDEAGGDLSMMAAMETHVYASPTDPNHPLQVSSYGGDVSEDQKVDNMIRNLHTSMATAATARSTESAL